MLKNFKSLSPNLFCLLPLTAHFLLPLTSWKGYLHLLLILPRHPCTVYPTALRPSLPHGLSEAINSLLTGEARPSSLHGCLSSCDTLMLQNHISNFLSDISTSSSVCPAFTCDLLPLLSAQAVLPLCIRGASSTNIIPSPFWQFPFSFPMPEVLSSLLILAQKCLFF